MNFIHLWLRILCLCWVPLNWNSRSALLYVLSHGHRTTTLSLNFSLCDGKCRRLITYQNVYMCGSATAGGVPTSRQRLKNNRRRPCRVSHGAMQMLQQVQNFSSPQLCIQRPSSFLCEFFPFGWIQIPWWSDENPAREVGMIWAFGLISTGLFLGPRTVVNRKNAKRGQSLASKAYTAQR